MDIKLGTVVFNQKYAGTRKGNLDHELSSALVKIAEELNVGIEIISGGQSVSHKCTHSFTDKEISAYSHLGRLGSCRHDAGKGADLIVYSDVGTGPDGRLNDNNPNKAEKEVLQQFVALGKEYGIKGWGSGHGYMDGIYGGTTFHVDLWGDEEPSGSGTNYWGKNNSESNAPKWLTVAYDNHYDIIGYDHLYKNVVFTETTLQLEIIRTLYPYPPSEQEVGWLYESKIPPQPEITYNNDLFLLNIWSMLFVFVGLIAIDFIYRGRSTLNTFFNSFLKSG